VTSPVKLTQYSHGSGCGCKIAPSVLTEILSATTPLPHDARLLVGNEHLDDAAVYRINEKQSIISTTDFFMPIVDDPFAFGGIASVNAISDVYAMGGRPLMAISILGWPVDKLSNEVASRVVDGAKDACRRAGIPLAGGHSIDTPEPIFGLAVTGIVDSDKVLRNTGADPGCELFLTKPLGVGIFTTAQKNGVLRSEDLTLVQDQMLQLNDIGTALSEVKGVKSLTDVTGFGLLGHLIEMCNASDVSAEINYEKVPILKGVKTYIDQKCYPGGTFRNYSSYEDLLGPLTKEQKIVLCDPQTSGGLLVAVAPEGREKFYSTIRENGIDLKPFGKIVPRKSSVVEIVP